MIQTIIDIADALGPIYAGCRSTDLIDGHLACDFALFDMDVSCSVGDLNKHICTILAEKCFDADLIFNVLVDVCNPITGRQLLRGYKKRELTNAQLLLGAGYTTVVVNFGANRIDFVRVKPNPEARSYSRHGLYEVYTNCVPGMLRAGNLAHPMLDAVLDSMTADCKKAEDYVKAVAKLLPGKNFCIDFDAMKLFVFE